MGALETGPGEFSYPAIIQTKQGIAIAYTWARQRVRCWQIPETALERMELDAR
jgi:predicted neuraminidase